MSNSKSRQKIGVSEYTILLIILILVLGFAVLDITTDFAESVEPWHIGVDFLVAILLVFGIAYLFLKIEASKNENKELRVRIRTARIQVEREKEAKQKLLTGVGDYIERQLNEWNFTPSEREVAFLLLKGLSLGEIAEIRGTTERTAKQHAINIYEKSGIKGRANFTAFFLEDFLASIEMPYFEAVEK